MIEVVTKSLEGTKALAQTIGAALRGGEVFELLSDVGGGKTSFVKGLALGLGIHDVVQSPTFTISRIYKARDGLELHHFDFYRLNDAGVVAAELAESLAQPGVIVAVEWGGIVHEVLPKDSIKVNLTAIDDQTRRIAFSIPAKHESLLATINTYKQQGSIA